MLSMTVASPTHAYAAARGRAPEKPTRVQLDKALQRPQSAGLGVQGVLGVYRRFVKYESLIRASSSESWAADCSAYSVFPRPK